MIENLNSVLKAAKKGGYAVGLFNTTDTDMLQAAIEAAEELRSPIVIGTAEILLPYGSLELIAPSVVACAKNASVPVVVHYDHGLTYDCCVKALKLGFSSIMFDGSVKSYSENVAETRELVKLAHSFGASVEGEIGHVGQASDTDDMYITTVEEAEQYIEDTDVDALAVAIGTAHGAYRKTPNLNFKRLKEISTAVDTPLVLHGGSGLTDSDFRQSIENGISKINIFTDLCLAGEAGMQEGLEKNIGYLEMRNLKMNRIKETVMEKLKLFGSVNKA